VRALEIANILKDWITKGEFLLTEPQVMLPTVKRIWCIEVTCDSDHVYSSGISKVLEPIDNLGHTVDITGFRFAI